MSDLPNQVFWTAPDELITAQFKLFASGLSKNFMEDSVPRSQDAPYFAYCLQYVYIATIFHWHDLTLFRQSQFPVADERLLEAF